jgi:hypothetical protein
LQLPCCSLSEFFFSNPRRYRRLILCAMVALHRLLLVLVCMFAELPQIDLLGPGRSTLLLIDWMRRSTPTRPATAQPSSRLLSRSPGSRIPDRRRLSLPHGRPPDGFPLPFSKIGLPASASLAPCALLPNRPIPAPTVASTGLQIVAALQMISRGRCSPGCLFGMGVQIPL